MSHHMNAFVFGLSEHSYDGAVSTNLSQPAVRRGEPRWLWLQLLGKRSTVALLRQATHQGNAAAKIP